MQPSPTTTTIDGVQAQLRRYDHPEADTKLFEYDADGCHVCLGRPGISGTDDLSVSINRGSFSRYSAADFHRLWSVYIAAANRHGFSQRLDVDAARAALDKSRGETIFWAGK